VLGLAACGEGQRRVGYLVLPGEPTASHSRAISGKADIKVVTYQKKGSKYQFTGLN